MELDVLKSEKHFKNNSSKLRIQAIISRMFTTIRISDCVIIKRIKTKTKIKPQKPGWRLEVGSRKRASYSEILERRWRHTLQA
jgi:hypothetical protein